MGEKCPIKFSHTIATSTVIVGLFYMPQSCDMGRHATSHSNSKEDMLRIISPENPTLRPGLNTRTWAPEASMLTTRPPKPLDPHLEDTFGGIQY
jgi:hypothetical protein